MKTKIIIKLNLPVRQLFRPHRPATGGSACGWLCGPAFLNFLCTLLFLACMLSFIPAIAFSEDAEQQPGDNEASFEATAGRLNLSDEQKEKIKTLRQTQRQQMEALLQELRTKRQQIKSELNNQAATRESIAPLVAEIKDIQSKMVDLRINNIFAIKKMLNSDQFNKLQQFQQQRTGERKERRQFWLDRRRGNKESKEETNQGK